MNYYKTTVKDIAELIDEVAKVMRPLSTKTFAIAVADFPLWAAKKEKEEWTEITKVELLIEIHRGTPVFKFNKAAGKWEPLDL